MDKKEVQRILLNFTSGEIILNGAVRTVFLWYLTENSLVITHKKGEIWKYYRLRYIKNLRVKKKGVQIAQLPELEEINFHKKALLYIIENRGILSLREISDDLGVSYGCCYQKMMKYFPLEEKCSIHGNILYKRKKLQCKECNDLLVLWKHHSQLKIKKMDQEGFFSNPSNQRRFTFDELEFIVKNAYLYDYKNIAEKIFRNPKQIYRKINGLFGICSCEAHNRHTPLCHHCKEQIPIWKKSSLRLLIQLRKMKLIESDNTYKKKLTRSNDEKAVQRAENRVQNLYSFTQELNIKLNRNCVFMRKIEIILTDKDMFSEFLHLRKRNTQDLIKVLLKVYSFQEIDLRNITQRTIDMIYLYYYLKVDYTSLEAISKKLGIIINSGDTLSKTIYNFCCFIGKDIVLEHITMIKNIHTITNGLKRQYKGSNYLPSLIYLLELGCYYTQEKLSELFNTSSVSIRSRNKEIAHLEKTRNIDILTVIRKKVPEFIMVIEKQKQIDEENEKHEK